MNFFAKKSNGERKDSTPESYTRAEKLLRASSASPHAPSDAYKMHLLQELKGKAFDHSPIPAMKTFTPHSWFKMLLPAAAALAVLAVLAYGAFQVWRPAGTPPPSTHPIVLDQPQNPQEIDGLFELVALNENDKGIHPTTAFELRTKAQTTIDKIKENLTFKPNVAFAIEQTSDTTYRLTPENSLDAGTILSASMNVTFTGDNNSEFTHTYSWAYEVQTVFQVVSTLPRHTATNVPLDTGIEFEFTHVGFTGAEQAFSIEPNAKGEFETHRKTFVFVPDKQLAKNTLYTIRLAKTVTLPLTGETLQGDVVVQFETGDGSDAPVQDSFTVSQKTNESSTTEAPSFLLMGYSAAGVPKVTVSMYAFPDSKSFANAFNELNSIPYWASQSRNAWSMETKGLALHSTSEVNTQTLDGYMQTAVTLPNTLPEGYYVAEFVVSDQHEQALLTVMDITAYATVSETQLVVWTHDAKTKKPLENAEVALSNGTKLGTTNATGVMSAATPASMLDAIETSLDTLSVTQGDRTLYIPLTGNAEATFGSYFYGYGGQNNAIQRVNPYWSYIYVDQPIYRPNDTLNYWGVAKPRRDGSLDAVEVRLQDPDWTYPEPRIISKRTVKPNAYGTVDGSIDLGNLNPGPYMLTIVVDGEIVTKTDVEVQSFTKPAYTLSLDPTSVGVLKGDSFTHTLRAEFLSGTPVANLKISGDGGQVTTDEFGVAKSTKTYSTYEEGRESYDWLDFSVVTAEEGDIRTNGEVRVFPAMKLFKTESSSEGMHATTAATLYTLDLEGFNNGTYGRFANPYGEPIARDDVHATVTRTWYTQEQVSTRYDFLQKKSIPVYNYISHEETTGEYDLKTNGDGKGTLEFDMQAESSYKVAFSAQDDDGRKVIEYAYAYPSDGYPTYESNSFELAFEETQSSPTRFQEWTGFSIGDEVKLGFYRDRKILPQTDSASFLYIQAQEGIRDSRASGSPFYAFDFAEEDIPNVVVQGVWFDGRSYWTTDGQLGMYDRSASASFDEKDRDLAIDIRADKEVYAPGDEVTLDVEVKRPDGSGTQASVNVNLVDEAIFIAFPRDVTFNATYYRDVASGVYSSYSSHRYPIGSQGAEGGGGGGVRKNFPDKAFFKTVETDKNGRARVTFTLPDNLTTWRITSHALDTEDYAGSTVEKLRVHQDFFVDAVMSNEYLTSDKPLVKIRTYGEAIDENTGVELTVSSDTLPMEPVGMTIKAFTSVDVPLTALSTGTHSVKIEAKARDRKDAILRTFTVTPSHLAVPVVETADVTAGWTPNVASERAIEVLFADNSMGQFYPRLETHAYTFGDRLDQQSSMSIARELLNEKFGESFDVPVLDAEAYQMKEGGITVFPYSDKDLELGAFIAASRMQDSFDGERLAQYFESVLNDETLTTLHHAQSLYGLGVLDKPVLLEIREVLKSDKITDVDRLYLALGLAELGDLDGAETIYTSLLTSYGKTVDSFLFLELGDTRDDQLKHTLLAATLGALIQNSSADQLFNYVEENFPQETFLTLAELTFMDIRMKTLSTTPVEMTVEHLGSPESFELAQGKTARYTLTSDAQKQFRVESVDGSATAIVKYLRASTPEEVNLDPTLSITRSYDKDVVKEGELVKVTLKFSIPASAPDGEYQITDFVPSGLRITTQIYRPDVYFYDSTLRYPYLVDGQRISFSAGKGGDRVYSYYARVVNKGTYTAEAPLIQSMNAPSVRMGGESATVTIE
ncbi:MAG: Ig-like domain-containing protein [Candidatus Kerfeldbacteria bacterium]|nr:Ig-like domain-containing protein [Candidatus Kerfeldbacteria bacterium]